MTAKTNAERQKALRKKRQEAGITEIRGLYAPANLHPAIRQMVREFLKTP